MKILLNILLAALFLFCTFTVFGGNAQWDGETLPPLMGRVNDYASLFSQEDIAMMTEISESLENNKGWQMVFVTVDSLGGRSIEEYGLFLGRGWGIGQSEENTGLLIIAAMQERQVRIEVGYGLEGVLTDAMSGRIIDNIIVPSFRNSDFAGGFIQAGKAVESLSQGESPVEGQADTAKSDDGSNITAIRIITTIQRILIFPFLLASFFLLVTYLSRKTKFAKNRKKDKSHKKKNEAKAPRKRLFGIALVVTYLFWLLVFSPAMGRGMVIPSLFFAFIFSFFQFGILSLFVGVILGGITGGTSGQYRSLRSSGYYSSSRSSFSSSFSSGSSFSGGGGSFGGGGASGGW